MTDTIKLFVAKHCAPCSEVKDLVSQGRFLIDGEPGIVDMLDSETEEGFSQLEKYDIDHLPNAIKEDGTTCKISIDREEKMVLIICGDKIGQT